ncbi:hypothetical protein BaRGS_00006699 [Batillaria attramentaria]|uniref:Hexosyltransferase n=1 Tax=Batillaria attramentaria TaxID=370345 RepID=A0ABD0LR53_9CAEN
MAFCRGAKKPRRIISCLTLLALTLSLLKFVYEFWRAQNGIDLSSRPVAKPGLAPLMPHFAAVADPGLDRSGRFLNRRTIPREGEKSGGAHADTKINAYAPIGYIAGRRSEHGESVAGTNSSLLLQFPSVLLLGNQQTEPFLVVLVVSKPENTQLRLAIRRTWGRDLNAERSEVVLRFFVGQDDSWDDIVEREQALHGDVMKTDFVDTYVNLSYKVLASISWAVGTFTTAAYVMKVDDDTYVNLPYLLHELRHDVMKGQYGVMGAVCVNSTVVRHPGDKWFVSDLDYPGDTYPKYVFGGGYVMTRAAAKALVAASSSTDYLHLEDVYVTGVLARRAGVRHLGHPGFSFWASSRPTPCEMLRNRVTAVNLTSRQFLKMYSGIHLLLRTGNWTAC